MAVVVFNLIFVCAREFQLYPHIQASNTQHLPSGVVLDSNKKLSFRDFHLHKAFVERIWGRVTTRPYTQEGQKEIFKNWIPAAEQGLLHPYSPVILLILTPFTWLDSWTAYYIFALFNILVLGALFAVYLLPRIQNKWQLASMAVMGFSLSTVHTISIGQTAVLTTAALACIWHILYNPKKEEYTTTSLKRDVFLGLILWGLSAKPQIALVAGVLLLGARAWRAALIGTLLFCTTFVALSPYYGGYSTAFTDYFDFLRNYSKDSMEPFFRWCFNLDGTSDLAGFLAIIFNIPERTTASICQPLTLICTLVTLVLAWLKKIKPTTSLQMQLAILFFLSPYLRTSEDIAIALLITSSGIIGCQPAWIESIKLGLLFLLMNLNPFFCYVSIHYAIKLSIIALLALQWAQPHKSTAKVVNGQN